MFVRSLAIGVSAAALMVGGAQAADLIIPTTPQPVYTAAGFDWEGLYVGARVGGQFVGSDSYAVNVDPDTTYGVVGAAVGVNFIPVDPILLGVEVTADYQWGPAGGAVETSSEFFANLRVGAIVTDNALVYALAGVGIHNNSVANEGVYQFGAGVEFAVTDAVTVRGEIVGQGDFDDTGSDAFFESAKATVGVFYHF